MTALTDFALKHASSSSKSLDGLPTDPRPVLPQLLDQRHAGIGRHRRPPLAIGFLLVREGCELPNRDLHQHSNCDWREPRPPIRRLARGALARPPTAGLKTGGSIARRRAVATL